MSTALAQLGERADAGDGRVADPTKPESGRALWIDSMHRYGGGVLGTRFRPIGRSQKFVET